MEQAGATLREILSSSFTRGISIGDSRFDELFPPEWRPRSPRFWTPVAVALRAASWFKETGCHRVLDIGSGVGKMCLVGALATDVDFVGVEHREPLVEVACNAARRLGLEERVSFIHGSIEAVDASAFRAFYLYNPFGENLYSEIERLDSTVELSAERYARDTRNVERIFTSAPLGARIITYHGFDGRVPNSYAPERVARIGSDALRLWVKRRSTCTGHYVEMGTDGIRLGPAGLCGDEDGPTDVSGR